jgi:hypothetical protein
VTEHTEDKTRPPGGAGPDAGLPTAPLPHPALKRLEPLIGTWTIRGRTPESQADNVSGTVVIRWLPGGHFQEQRGELHFMGAVVHGLEIVAYDPATNTFPSTVYSNLSPEPAAYHWDVRGDVVTHWTHGSKYTGRLGADGNTLMGGWRPEDDSGGPGSNYDAVMSRVK